MQAMARLKAENTGGQNPVQQIPNPILCEYQRQTLIATEYKDGSFLSESPRFTQDWQQVLVKPMR